jgi:hypothetical protein
MNDDAAGTAVSDSSGNSNTGTLQLGTLGNTNPAVAWVADQWGGYALSFDGADDYVSVPDKPALRTPSTEITIEAWMFFPSNPGAVQLEIRKWIDSDGGYGSYVIGNTADNKIYASVQSKTPSQYPSWTTQKTIGELGILGQWAHIAFVWKKNAIDSTDGKIYVNKTAVATTYAPNGYSSAFTVGYGSYPLYFGRKVTAWSSNYFLGKLDEVRIWSSALTATQLDDMAAPAITITTPSDGATYSLGQTVNADWSVSDGTGTGVDPTTITATAASGSPINTATAGDKTFAVTATDYAKNTATTTVTYHVLKATPVITWSNPADIVYGTALSGTQLNATASWLGAPVAGSFVYTPPAGTVLNAGSRQTLHVDFTPTDTANYNSASKDVTINVLYAFGSLGLLPPYAAPPRAFKIGSSIPLKWQYTDSAGNVVDSAAANPQVQIKLTGAGGGETDGLIELNDPGSSGLRYDSLTMTWQYNWQTKGLSTGLYNIYIKSKQTGQVNGPFTIQLR